MPTIIGLIVSAAVGGVIAGGASFGLISSQTAVPPTVDSPYVVYGANQ